MADTRCDVWLLTEVNEQLELEGFYSHLSKKLVDGHRHWAGTFSWQRPDGLPDPHVAGAAAVVDGVTYCSTVLPWGNTKGDPNWPGETHAERTSNALAALWAEPPTTDRVWGGDWNIATSGPVMDGSKGAREHVRAAVGELGLEVATADLPHRIDGYLSIDHIAVPSDWVVTGAQRLDARGLSDHDCYVVDVAEP